jgi:hypothetical protein
MKPVSIKAACKSYKTTLIKFEELVTIFGTQIAIEHGFGEEVLNDLSTRKTRYFEVLGEIIEVSISPTASKYIVGKIEFNLIIDSGKKSKDKSLLLLCYLNSDGEIAFKLDDNRVFENYFDLEESFIEMYITKVVLQKMLEHYGINTH